MKIYLIILAIVGLICSVLTYWSNLKRPPYRRVWAGVPLGPKARLIFNPDPIYDFDKQLCNEFARGLHAKGWEATVMSVAQAETELDIEDDLIVVCANTYNWRPDRTLTNYILNHDLRNKPIIAITLGTGSTEASKEILEQLILDAGGVLLDSRTFWLLKPNDESSKMNNILVAKSLVFEWATHKADSLMIKPN